ncbi:MAG: TlpA family protein disulfide reductase [Ignavibacteria bacterium]|nr:TlpA family protein disulfide reductase [Ignavibacteria bacterium]
MKKILFVTAFLFIAVLNLNAQSYYNFTLQNLENDDVTLDELIAKGPVLISFWATWCSPCKEEMKKLQPIFEKYKDQGFTYLAVNQDNQKSIAKVKSYINANKYTFPVVLDTDKKIFEAYGGIGMPYSILIDMNKNIAAKHLGYVTGDDKKIEKEIQEVLMAGSNYKGDK